MMAAERSKAGLGMGGAEPLLRMKPSPPQRIISRLKGTFIKRYILKRTSKTEIRPEAQSEKAESCRENLLNEKQLNVP